MMMSPDDLSVIEAILQDLKIEVATYYKDGSLCYDPVLTINVKLLLNGQVISESESRQTLPDPRDY